MEEEGDEAREEERLRSSTSFFWWKAAPSCRMAYAAMMSSTVLQSMVCCLASCLVTTEEDSPRARYLYPAGTGPTVWPPCGPWELTDADDQYPTGISLHFNNRYTSTKLLLPSCVNNLQSDIPAFLHVTL